MIYERANVAGMITIGLLIQKIEGMHQTFRDMTSANPQNKLYLYSCVIVPLFVGSAKSHLISDPVYRLGEREYQI